jgi:aspartyl protease family protein
LPIACGGSIDAGVLVRGVAFPEVGPLLWADGASPKGPYKIVGSQFYDISRMYAALGRYCDAIGPIETFISFDPAERRTPQTTKIISEYAEKGNCDTHFASGVARAPLLKAMGVHALSVAINGVAGSFILDSGAAWVSVTPEFSTKAKINIEAAGQLPMKTVGLLRLIALS